MLSPNRGRRMKAFVVMVLAASALAPASAAAQQRTAAPPVKWEDTPNAHFRIAAPPPPAAQAPTPGVSWHAPAAAAPMRRHVEVRPAPPHVAPPPVVHHAPVVADARRGDRMDVRRHRGERAMRRHHGARNFSHYRRIDRGFALPHAWWGPQFQIRNWSMYGLPAPIHGGRWVRYYDDALMVDGYGRVHDGRWGMGWDRWEDQWAYDDRGVPVYVGDGDYYPGEDDYGWAGAEDGYAEGYEDYGYGGGYGHGGCRESCAPYPHHMPAYGYGWGYGGMVVTETTVTTPTVIEETWVEEEVVTERRRAHKPRKYRPRPRPQPLPGERG